MTLSQNTLIATWLEKGRSITPLVALSEFGSLRLGARIYDLKKRGYNIVKTWESDGRKRWARYSLVSSPKKRQAGK